MIRKNWTRRGFLAASAAPLLAADGFERVLERLVEPVGATLGFAMRHLESGESRAVRGDEPFAMASVYKLPIALTVLDAVDRGELSLSRKLRLGPGDLRLGLGNNEVERLVGQTGHDFAVEELLRRTLVDSDNACSDALLGLVGAEAVTRRMRALGVDGIRVDRPEVDLLLDFIGADTQAPAGGWTLDQLRSRYRSAEEPQRRRALIEFVQDPRDTATPNAMVDLLVKVHQGEALSRDSSRKLVGWMEACATGGRRLRGDLPDHVVFAHRTGTTDSTAGVTAGTNDVGILTLPGGRGHVAIAAFLRLAQGTMEQRELILAHIGRAVYERYVGA